MGFTEVANRIRRNDLRLAGAAIIAEKLTISSAAINGVGIRRIRSNVTALAGACGVPIAEGDSAVIAAAEDVHAAAILLRAVNVVRKFVVYSDVIELGRRLVVPTAPGVAAINAHAHTLIAAENQSLRVRRINPEGMIVVAAGSALDGDKSFSRIGRTIDGDIGNVNRVRVFGIDVNFAEVPEAAEARIMAGANPGLAAIVGLEHATLFRVDERIDALAMSAARNGQAYASPISAGKAASCYWIPDVAAIGGFIDCAGNGDWRISAPGRATIMQQRRPDGLRMIGIKRDIDSAGVFIAV